VAKKHVTLTNTRQELHINMHVNRNRYVLYSHTKHIFR